MRSSASPVLEVSGFYLGSRNAVDDKGVPFVQFAFATSCLIDAGGALIFSPVDGYMRPWSGGDAPLIFKFSPSDSLVSELSGLQYRDQVRLSFSAKSYAVSGNQGITYRLYKFQVL